MSLSSSIHNEGSSENIADKGRFSLSDITTFFNVFQVLMGNTSVKENIGNHSSNIVVEMIMAMFIVAIAQHIHKFMTKTWPSWMLRIIQNIIGSQNTRDVAVVDVFRNQPEEYAFDNEILVIAMQYYVSHMLQTTTEVDKSDKDNINRVNGIKSIKLPYSAEYCYIPLNVPNGIYRKDVAKMLQRFYRLVILPEEGNVIEVEPGLTIYFQHQLVSPEILRKNKLIPRKGGESNEKDFINLNFDTRYPKDSLLYPNNNNNDYKGNEDEDNDTEEESSEDLYSSVDGAKQDKKVLIRQAVLQCSDNKDGRERIVSFARRAYAFYISTLEDPTERYYFYPSFGELERAAGIDTYEPFEISQRFHLRRYLLNSERSSFNSLFFPQKSQLITLLEEFKDKKGRFSIPGVPHQLVILLYGAPGTGKTSIIRRVAKFLNRHIFSIPIHLIHTNGALHEILSGGTTLIHGEEERKFWEFDDSDDGGLFGSYYMPLTLELPVDKVVYTFEDIDVVSDRISFKPSFKHLHSRSPSTSSSAKENDKDKINNSNTSEKESIPSNENSKSYKDSEKTSDNEDKEYAESLGFDKKTWRSFQKLLSKDFLSPAGFLRALDPTFSPPGRVIIFTTNHPDRIPEVLFQPGVLTLSIHMDNLDTPTAMDLIKHYCQDSLTFSREVRIKELIAQCEEEKIKEVMNPASLEHMLLVSDDAGELLKELELRCS